MTRPSKGYVTGPYHVPLTVLRFDETILFSGDVGVAKNRRVVSRINSGQAARNHVGAALCPHQRPRQRKYGCECDRATKQIPQTHHVSLPLVHSVPSNKPSSVTTGLHCP